MAGITGITSSKLFKIRTIDLDEPFNVMEIGSNDGIFIIRVYGNSQIIPASSADPTGRSYPRRLPGRDRRVSCARIL